MRRKSSNSVVIKSADRHAVEEAVHTYVADLRARYPEAEKLIWFGSWVAGLPRPGSDADLCLILSDSSESARDRISRYLPSRFPVGIDLCVYTRREFDRLRKEHPEWFATIMSGIEFQIQDTR